MFDVIIKNDKNEIDYNKEGIFYVVGKEGTFLRKNLDIINSLTPVKNIDFLGSVEPFASLNLPKIRKAEFEKVTEFFRQIYTLYQSEVMVLMYLNTENNKICFDVPDQTVTSATIDYESLVQDLKYRLIGTIHSHGSMGAFHSGTDVNDEANFDGLHITIGNIDREDNSFSLSCEVVVTGMRQEVYATDYIAGIKGFEVTKTYNYPKSYNKACYPFGFGVDPAFRNKIKESESVKKESSQYFKINNPKLGEEWKNDIWLSRVKKKVYKSIRTNYDWGHGILPAGLVHPHNNMNWMPLNKDKDKKLLTNKVNAIFNSMFDNISKKKEKVKEESNEEPESLIQTILNVYGKTSDDVGLEFCDVNNIDQAIINLLFDEDNLEHWTDYILDKYDMDNTETLKSADDTPDVDYSYSYLDDYMTDFDDYTDDIINDEKEIVENPKGNNPQILSEAKNKKSKSLPIKVEVKKREIRKGNLL